LPASLIDTHQHLWDLSKFRLPWQQQGSVLARSYGTEDYARATQGLRVVKAVYMEVDLDPSQQQAEADFVVELCQRGDTPTVAGVISGRPASEHFRKYTTPFRDHRYIKGLRQVLHNKDIPAGYCLDRRFIQGIQLLGELGLRYDICIRPGELFDAVRLIDACPGTSFILDHCGNADVQAKDRTQWKRDMEAIGKRQNVVGKVSGILASAKPGHWRADDLAPVINHTLTVFGPDRVMFGGDWPVCLQAATYRQWVEALDSIVKDRPEVEQRKLFHDNALRFYKLV
jgi:L-fuconolactonase